MGGARADRTPSLAGKSRARSTLSREHFAGLVVKAWNAPLVTPAVARCPQLVVRGPAQVQIAAWAERQTRDAAGRTPDCASSRDQPALAPAAIDIDIDRVRIKMVATSSHPPLSQVRVRMAE